MSTFDDREKGFEAKYKHDQELQFKIVARRNKLFGMWAAEKLGKSGASAESYAKDVIAADFEKPGDDDVTAKVLADLEAAGKNFTLHDVQRELHKCADAARTQVMAEAKENQ